MEKHVKRSGRNCLANGIRYERRVLLMLSETAWREHPIVTKSRTGGATRLNDIVVVVDGKKVVFEVKNKNSFEGGGRVLKDADGSLTMPIGLLGNEVEYTPWKGRIPSFLRGDKNIERWKVEKPYFRDEYRPVSIDAMRLYYKEKGVDYIQIEGKGLYHTGNDPLVLGVPPFSCFSRIRIRCKQHTSSTLPGSVQASLVFSRKRLVASPYDLESCLRRRKNEDLG